MFSGRPSVPLSVCASMHPSVIHVVVLCFRDISSIRWRIFAKLLSLVHLGTQMTWLRFWIKRSKFKVTPSRRRHTALDATVECNFSSLWEIYVCIAVQFPLIILTAIVIRTSLTSSTVDCLCVRFTWHHLFTCLTLASAVDLYSWLKTSAVAHEWGQTLHPYNGP